MATILLIDDALFCRELVGKAMRQAGYQVITATNGLEGLAALAQSTVQLIVLDNEMPLMDGPAFLHRLRENPTWSKLPVIMLTDNAEKEKVLVARQFGAVEYVLKAHFSLGKLLERIRKWLPNGPSTDGNGAHLARAEQGTEANRQTNQAVHMPADPDVRPTLSVRKRVIQAIDSIDDARTLGGVVARVLEIASSPRAGLRELVQVVQQDPVLSARTLQLANSAAFATHRLPIANLEDAVKHVGATNVRTLAMSIGVFETLLSGGELNLGLVRCWSHALAVAGLMDRLSAGQSTGLSSENVDPGICRVAGLCHDLAEILLRQRMPAEFAKAEQVALASKVSLYSVLPGVCGLSYDDVTERLLTKLRVPIAISQPVLEHARRESGKDNPVTSRTSRLLSIADRYANGLLLASSVTAMVAPVLVSEYSIAVPIDDDGLRKEVLGLMSAMAKLPAVEEQEMMRPLLPKQALHLIYARDPRLSPFDPVGSAIGAMFEVEMREPESIIAVQRTGGPAVVVATPRIDTPLYSNLANTRIESEQMNGSSVFFLVGRAPRAEVGGPSRRLLCQYPISLQALKDLLEQNHIQKSAA